MGLGHWILGVFSGLVCWALLVPFLGCFGLSWKCGLTFVLCFGCVFRACWLGNFGLFACGGFVFRFGLWLRVLIAWLVIWRLPRVSFGMNILGFSLSWVLGFWFAFGLPLVGLGVWWVYVGWGRIGFFV